MKKCSLCAAVVLISVMSLFAQDKRRQFDPDEAYKNTCMRCHTSTQQYSPRMTKTIVMHMRVRANLTQEEALAILKYLTDDAFGQDAQPEKQRPMTSRAQTVGNESTLKRDGKVGDND
jgi:hypothetical protein